MNNLIVKKKPRRSFAPLGLAVKKLKSALSLNIIKDSVLVLENLTIKSGRGKKKTY